MIHLKSYSGQQDAKFYIQCKGNHSGRPLKDPIPNSFAVYTDVPNAFEIIYGLYKSRTFQTRIIGSVVPFIRKRDLMEILEPAFKKSYDPKKLEAIALIDKQIENELKRIELLKKMQRALAIQVLKESK